MGPLKTLALVIALFIGPALLHAQREKLPPDDIDIVESKWPNAQKTGTGIRYVVETSGKGAPLNPGDMVGVTYIGSLLNGKVFDKNLDPKHPFTFRVGRNFVIEGWDQILQLMTVGDKWIVIIPPELGYGRKGSPPRIAGDSTLVFEIQVVSVEREN
jgi:FKBP-type peptidyl-prolyl cis-trans isomerase